jgi:hypothetical protein
MTTSDTISGRLVSFFIEKLNFKKAAKTYIPTYDEIGAVRKISNDLEKAKRTNGI